MQLDVRDHRCGLAIFEVEAAADEKHREPEPEREEEFLIGEVRV